MSTVLGELGGAALNTVGETISYTAGASAHRAVDPVSVAIAQKAWALAQIQALDAVIAAMVAAEDVDQYDRMATEATYSGYDADRFKDLYGVTLNAPGTGQLLTMARRETITPDTFAHGLRKARLEPLWDEGLIELQTERLDPAVIAVSGQRGTMDDAGLLPVGPPTEVGRVPPMPVSPLDTLKEAAASGIDSERLAVMMRNVGLPPGPGQLLELLNRDAIDLPDFYRGVSEGNIRNEWGPFLLNLRRRLLTPHEYAELQLRGWITQADRDTGAALSGMEPADTQLLFDMLGRSLNVHAVTTGLARGGTFGGDYEGVPEPYLTALRQSNVRPEWGNIAWWNRYTYPSAFVIRTLAQTGELAPADVEQTLLDIGWKPDLAAKVTTAWTGNTGTTTGPHETKAQTQLWGTIHKSFVNDESDETVVRDTLPKAGVAADEIDGVLATWTAERALIRRQLTAAQIKKAIGQPGKDKAWATERLLDLGYNTDDAATFLDE